MAEEEGKHRRRIEWFSQIAGFLLLAGSLVAGVYLIGTGKAVGTMAVGQWSGGGLVAIVVIVLVIWAFRRR